MRPSRDDLGSRRRQIKPATWIAGLEGARWHLRLLAAAAVVLILANLVSDPDRLWALPVLGVWGVVVLIHFGVATAVLSWLVEDEPVPAIATNLFATWRGADGASLTDARISPTIVAQPRDVAAAPASPVMPSTAFPEGALPAASHPAVLPDVAALWNGTAPTTPSPVAEQQAGWRWGPPIREAGVPQKFGTSSPPATVQTAQLVHDAPVDEGVPVSLLGSESIRETSLTGD